LRLARCRARYTPAEWVVDQEEEADEEEEEEEDEEE